MSARSTRNTQSVRATPAMNTGAAVATGVGLVAVAAILALKLGAALGGAAVQSLRQSSGKLELPQSLVAAASVPLTASTADLKVGGSLGLSAVQSLKLATLSSLARSPLVVDQKQIETQMSAFELAQSPTQVKQASLALRAAIAQSNDRLLVSSLSIAVQEASAEVGFHEVEVVQASPHLVRINATQPSGRALVTEIRSLPGQAPQVDSEVVGMSDKSCLPILQALDQALAKRGVVLANNKSHFTGGVPESDAVRVWLSKRMAPRRTTQPTPQVTTPKTNPALSRSRMHN